jgi:TRAP-type C4-dicarboxylate transport system permease small subunit
MLVSRLGPFGKKLCLGASYCLMLFACWLLFKGAYDQAIINLSSTSAVMEASMAWLYLPGILFAVFGGLILLVEFVRLITGRVRDGDLVMIQESEEAPHGGNH